VAGEQPLGDAVADGQLHVGAGGAHGDPDRAAGDAQLQRLLDDEPVAGLADPAVAHADDPVIGDARHRALLSAIFGPCHAI
jgi:hypothetical protein